MSLRISGIDQEFVPPRNPRMARHFGHHRRMASDGFRADDADPKLRADQALDPDHLTLRQLPPRM